MAKLIHETFPCSASELIGPCTRRIVVKMLRNRGYSLEETAYKKDQGIVKIYMFHRWTDPMLFQIGEYLKGFEPNWAAVYDRAMRQHIALKRRQS